MQYGITQPLNTLMSYISHPATYLPLLLQLLLGHGLDLGLVPLPLQVVRGGGAAVARAEPGQRRGGSLSCQRNNQVNNYNKRYLILAISVHPVSAPLVKLTSQAIKEHSNTLTNFGLL